MATTVTENGNEKLLLLQLQQGSTAAFTRLYDTYSLPLYRNIFRLVRDSAIAEELLQDLFLKIWEQRALINPERSFRSFLYKVAQNLVNAHFRRVAQDKRLFERLVTAAVESDGYLEDVVIAKEDQGLLSRAIEKLSPQRRQVYILCKLEGKSYEEVSTELGISTSTIRDHIVKGNKAVRDYFMLHQDVALTLLTASFLFTIK